MMVKSVWLSTLFSQASSQMNCNKDHLVRSTKKINVIEGASTPQALKTCSFSLRCFLTCFMGRYWWRRMIRILILKWMTVTVTSPLFRQLRLIRNGRVNKLANNSISACPVRCAISPVSHIYVSIFWE
ncbi:hypothetical protein E1A91_D08G221900v1 [Gossypium mustelinum]|uniref:Secreted protein n=1 Tax=Gossypium mustelinum TaxID=34275 RepID=A0A5D2TYP7_GOSMU|nr:hypothetical protein E1A91_D08G221900v1 [Gossypium mustelinum]